jgi:transposase, IS5 family
MVLRDERPCRVDKDSGLIHWVMVTAANVQDLTPDSELLHGDKEEVYGDAGCQGIAKRPEIAGNGAEFRMVMRPGKRRDLPDTPEGRLHDLIETAKAHIRSKVEHPVRAIKQQFSFEKTRLRGLAKNRCKINVLAALTNLFLSR